MADSRFATPIPTPPPTERARRGSEFNEAGRGAAPYFRVANAAERFQEELTRVGRALIAGDTELATAQLAALTVTQERLKEALNLLTVPEPVNEQSGDGALMAEAVQQARDLLGRGSAPDSKIDHPDGVFAHDTNHELWWVADDSDRAFPVGAGGYLGAPPRLLAEIGPLHSQCWVALPLRD